MKKGSKVEFVSIVSVICLIIIILFPLEYRKQSILNLRSGSRIEQGEALCISFLGGESSKRLYGPPLDCEESGLSSEEIGLSGDPITYLMETGGRPAFDFIFIAEFPILFLFLSIIGLKIRGPQSGRITDENGDD